MTARPVLGRAEGTTDEDPFSPGDPLEVARLVRRALAAAKRRAAEVGALVVVTDRSPPAGTLARFTRRALGPHGAQVRSEGRLVAPDLPHPGRVATGEALAASGPTLTMVVVLGPDDRATVLCFG